MKRRRRHSGAVVEGAKAAVGGRSSRDQAYALARLSTAFLRPAWWGRHVGTVSRRRSANQCCYSFLSDNLCDGWSFRILPACSRLHARVLGAGRRYLNHGRSGRARTGHCNCCARRAGDGCQRQLHGADVDGDFALLPGDRRCVALHPARQADAERVCRVVQRPTARRERYQNLETQVGLLSFSSSGTLTILRFLDGIRVRLPSLLATRCRRRLA